MSATPGKPEYQLLQLEERVKSVDLNRRRASGKGRRRVAKADSKTKNQGYFSIDGRSSLVFR
jgi:hypothetical protein